MPQELDDERRAAATRRALELVTEAMDLLDGHDGPAEAAAHFELAAQILRQTVADGRVG